MSPDQTRMIDDPRPVLWIGTGTKTGKTVALAQWVVEGVALGERCAWIGPWFKRTRTGFEHVAGAYAATTRAGLTRARENDLSLTFPKTGGHLECFSGDNPDSIFGEGLNRVVIDEAGRQPAGVLAAVLSTVTATRGKVRIAFNLDRGRRHWAVAGLLAARSGSDASHGAMTMQTAASPYVAPEAIALARRTLPDRVFRALYLAEIQDDAAGVFRGISDCVAGDLEKPRPGGVYVLGVDLARTLDWTVAVVIDVDRKAVVGFERFHGLPWVEQRRRIQALAEAYNRAHVVVDATGVGDPNAEELIRAGLNVTPFVFTSASKPRLIEALIVAIEQRHFTFPYLDDLVNELEMFEYELMPSGAVRYAAPDGSGMHDDCVMALALAYHGAFGAVRESHGFLRLAARAMAAREARA